MKESSPRVLKSCCFSLFFVFAFRLLDPFASTPEPPSTPVKSVVWQVPEFGHAVKPGGQTWRGLCPGNGLRLITVE